MDIIYYRPDTELASTTTFKPYCRSNSTNISGSIRRQPSRPLKQKPLRQCLIPTRSGYEFRLAAALRHTVSIT